MIHALIAATLSLAATDLPLPAAGLYTLQGQVAVSNSVRYETVYALNEAGRARLAELHAAGQACRSVGREAYQCRCDFCGPGPMEKAAAWFTAELENSRIVLGERKGEPSRRTKGETYEEWSVPQAVELRNSDYASWRLMRLPGLDKGVVGEPTRDGWILHPDHLEYVGRFTVKESKNVFWGFFGSAPYRR